MAAERLYVCGGSGGDLQFLPQDRDAVKAVAVYPQPLDLVFRFRSWCFAQTLAGQLNTASAETRRGSCGSYQGESFRIEVPAGFQFDLSSIPRVFWTFGAPFELSIVAPLIHDYIYRRGGNLPPGGITPPRVITRKEADSLFLHIMAKERVPRWEACDRLSNHPYPGLVILQAVKRRSGFGSTSNPRDRSSYYRLTSLTSAT